MKRVDHAEASSRFIAAKEHVDFHDQRLWDLRQKRDREAALIPEWEDLRSLASAIKEHALSRLADYLEEFERNATANGMTVHWARDAAEHNQIVHDILAAHGARTLVKSKSMLTDECDMRHRDHRDRPRRAHPAARRRAAEPHRGARGAQA
jgi:L-lactate dehydrogenase complex protein LldF